MDTPLPLSRRDHWKSAAQVAVAVLWFVALLLLFPYWHDHLGGLAVWFVAGLVAMRMLSPSAPAPRA